MGHFGTVADPIFHWLTDQPELQSNFHASSLSCRCPYADKQILGLLNLNAQNAPPLSNFLSSLCCQFYFFLHSNLPKSNIYIYILYMWKLIPPWQQVFSLTYTQFPHWANSQFRSFAIVSFLHPVWGILLKDERDGRDRKVAVTLDIHIQHLHKGEGSFNQTQNP